MTVQELVTMLIATNSEVTKLVRQYNGFHEKFDEISKEIFCQTHRAVQTSVDDKMEWISEQLSSLRKDVTLLLEHLTKPIKKEEEPSTQIVFKDIQEKKAFNSTVSKLKKVLGPSLELQCVPRKPHHVWTDEEIEELVALKGRGSHLEFAKKVGVLPSSVYSKKSLILKRRKK